ncbi:MAG: hypothetical protein ABGY11_07880, partial [Candidatus Thioglobus sp.]
QRTVNPFVGGSSPPRGAIFINQDTSGCLFLCLKSIDTAVLFDTVQFYTLTTSLEILTTCEYNCEYYAHRQ